MLKLHHASKTRSVRVLWLLEELGVPYELNVVPFTQEFLKSPAFLRVNPCGSLPAIEDDGVVMFESGAILEYLLERYGNGRLAVAPGSPARPRYLQWFHFGEATLLPPLGDIAQHALFRPEAERIPAMVADGQRRAAARLDVLEQALAASPYLCGDAFTAADVMVGYGVAIARLLGVVGERHPNVAAYLARLEARPAFQKAFA
ncbi:MAG TPA: glutathione S-transferase family protein [Candidatus Limnocylindria bacterium]|nr:glutathione S-transferase family protein [Candidatus Limnocylindria bacterium]